MSDSKLLVESEGTEKLTFRLPADLKQRWLEACEQDHRGGSSAVLRRLVAEHVGHSMDMDRAGVPDRAARTIRLDDDLVARWRAFCRTTGQRPTMLVAELMEREMRSHATSEGLTERYMVATGPDAGPRRRIQIALTPTEHAALDHRAEVDGFSPARWIVQLIRVALTSDPALTEGAERAVQDAADQMRRIGNSFNQMVKRLHLQDREPRQDEIESAIRIINRFSDWHRQVADLVGAHLDRWGIFLPADARREWERHGRKLKPWSERLAKAKLGRVREGGDGR